MTIAPTGRGRDLQGGGRGEVSKVNVYLVVELPSDGDLQVSAYSTLAEADKDYDERKADLEGRNGPDDDPWSDADGIEAGFEDGAWNRVWKLKAEVS